GAARPHPRRHARRRHGAPADGERHHQPALPRSHLRVRATDRRAADAQHQLQRARADRRHAGRSAGLLPQDPNGRAGAGQLGLDAAERMRTAAAAFILSMLCGTFLTPLVRRLAHRFGALDHARSSRKIHGHPVPRLGGIAIVIAFYVPLVGLMLFHGGVGLLFLSEREHVIGLFAGGLVIALLGLYDDLRGANAWKKFAVQFLVAGILFQLGFRFDVLANPFGEPIHLGWANLPFTLFWIVGVINAMNLIDGLDGLAGGVALVAVITTFLVSLQRAHPLMMLFSSALAGSIIGFLFYNFNPASIFMGDTGSMFLGFVLATTA